MGKSKSIEEKMADDTKFREFMDQIQDASKKEEDRIADEMRSIVKKHYEGNKWDYARLSGNKQSDYQNYDSWGLERIVKIIDSIGTALAGAKYPSAAVPGSDDASSSTIEKAKEFAGVFAGDYSLIIARVQALISGVLSQFSVASEGKRSTVQKDMIMAGGLHLFFGSSGSVFTQQAFFTNQFIGSFQIVFEVYMSVAEAKAIGIQQLLKTTEIELDFVNKQIIEIRTYQAESLSAILKKDPKDYVSTKKAYDKALKACKEDRAALLVEYDKYKNVIETVDENFNRIDLSEFNRPHKGKNTILIENLFNDWEAGIARRYIAEKLSKE